LLADEIAPHLPQELDFVREGQHLEFVVAHIKKSGLECIVTKVIWKNTAQRVLTMEFEEGFRATYLNANDKSGLSKQ
jgi:aarF domain-containing kinase